MKILCLALTDASMQFSLGRAGRKRKAGPPPQAAP